MSVTKRNIWALFGASSAFEVAVGNMSIHFTLKHKVRNWLNEAEVDRNSGKSVRSKSSSHSKSSSGSLKSRLAVKKAKLAETGAEPKYVEKKQ